mmetsp:Transcript_81126/g.158490  ORF Transcript_81126/g.158490 Transcript_81126/m.158490 type:complete len:149 (+) Transcript_81126:270-716(+)
MARQTEQTKAVPSVRGRRWQKQLAALMSMCAGRGERNRWALSAALGRKANKSWGRSAVEVDDDNDDDDDDDGEQEASSSAPPVRSAACCMNLHGESTPKGVACEDAVSDAGTAEEDAVGDGGEEGISVHTSTMTFSALAAVMQFMTAL